MALFAEWTPTLPPNSCDASFTFRLAGGRCIVLEFCWQGCYRDNKSRPTMRIPGGLTRMEAEELLLHWKESQPVVARYCRPIMKKVLSACDPIARSLVGQESLQTSVNPQDASQQEAKQLQAKVQNLEERLMTLQGMHACQEQMQEKIGALTVQDAARQKEVCELREMVETLKKALEDATQREASQLKAQINRFEEGQEALRASINAQTAAMIAQQAWMRAHAPGVERISAPGPSDVNSWTLVGLSQQGTVSGISVDSGGPRCFLVDAVFKTPLGLCEASDLHQGSDVVAENGRLLRVVSEPEQHMVNVSIELQTAGARLQITPDHRIVVQDHSTVARWKFCVHIDSG